MEDLRQAARSFCSKFVKHFNILIFVSTTFHTLRYITLDFTALNTFNTILFFLLIKLIIHLRVFVNPAHKT